MRGHRRHHAQINIQRFLPFRRSGGALFARLVHFIEQFHQTGNHRIEFESIEIARHASQGLVQSAPQVAQCLRAGSRLRRRLGEQRPHAPDPARRALDAAAVPRRAHIPACKEHQV